MESRGDVPRNEIPATVKPPGSQRTKSRTSRACDRCRVKKAKCDGRPQCKQCRINDSACMYTARRGREAREYYSRMCKVTDEAIQILFTSCQQNGCFPGNLPHVDEHGRATTDAVLQALGLIQPIKDEPGSTFHQIEDGIVEKILPREHFRNQRQESQHSTDMATPASDSVDDVVSESQVSETADNHSQVSGQDRPASSYFESAYLIGPTYDTNFQAAYLDMALHQIDLGTGSAPIGENGQSSRRQLLDLESLFDTTLLPTPRA